MAEEIDPVNQRVAELLSFGVPEQDIVSHLSQSKEEPHKLWVQKWKSAQTAERAAERIPPTKLPVTTELQRLQKLAEENPITTAAAATVGTGLLTAGAYVAKEKFKTREEIRKARELAKIEPSEAVKIQRDQLILGEQKLDLDKQKFQAEQNTLIANENKAAINTGKLNAYSIDKHGFPLSTLEEASGGRLTKPSDIDIVAQSLKAGRGLSVNPIPGTVSNKPPGIPTAVSPMSQLRGQPTPPVAPINVAPPATPVDLVAAAQSGQDMSQPIKEDVAHMLQEADKTPSEIKVKGLVRDAQGNFQYPPGMSPAAIEGHKAFNQQYPEHARALEAEGKFGIVGGGAADNNLKNSYGVDLRKRILNEVNQGQMAGIYPNYSEKINPAIQALPKESGLGKILEELRVNNPKGGIQGPLGTPATIGKLGELVSKPGAVSGLVNKGSIPLLLMAMAEAANANQSKLGNAVVPPKTSEGGAAFGGFTSGKKYQAAKLRAEQGDVNTLPDPRTYAAVQGLMGVPPDQLGFSVLHPDYKNIRDVADPAYAASILATLLPGLSKFGKK